MTVLQRLPSHPVEVWSGGRYLRLFETAAGPVAWIVSQPRGAARLRIELRGQAGALAPWRRRVARALGTTVDLATFRARAGAFPRVAAMVRAADGVKPPRFQALHESLVSVLLFQQVSLASAVATLRRLVVGLTRPVEVDGVVLHPFPSAAALAGCSEADLRGFGMSGAKARALRATMPAIASGALTGRELDRLDSGALEERLRALPGVGPWTAALVMLRGFGRLDRFPPGDVVADRLMQRLGAGASGGRLLEALGDVRGLLYYHLFLDRMAREGLGPFAARPA